MLSVPYGVTTIRPKPIARCAHLHVPNMDDSIVTSAREVRAIFNTRVLPRLRAGELAELVLRTGTARPAAGQPVGTLSEEVLYLDHGQSVAYVHRFVTPDGEIGASGLPDPKAVRFGDDWLVVDLE